MPTTAFHDQASPQRFTSHRNDLLPLLLIAGAVAAAHIATNGRYGFHRDELQFLADARHMDWGFVAYPPLTPFLERISLAVFGLSMAGLRLFSVLAQATAIVVAGLTARELGGRRLAQVSSALVIALSPLPLFQGTEFQYSSFDYLWWVLIAYFIVRLLKSENRRWWLAIGVTVGIALLTKYSVIFFIAGILGGMLLSRARRWFVSIWFWAGVGIAFVIFLPNFLWQVHHDFISYTFLQHIHVRDVRQGRADDFLVGQLLICINVVAAPLAFAGLIFYLRDRRYRMLGWTYLITFALFFVGKGRHYYLAPAYPMLLAMGASGAERWLLTLPRIARRAIPSVFFAGLVLCGTYIYAVVLPIAASGPLREFALKRNGDLREEFGWDEMVRTVAGIRDSLPPRSAGSPRDRGRQLRRTGRDRTPRACIQSPGSHQHRQLSVAVGLSHVAPLNDHRAGQQLGERQQDLHWLPSGWTQRKFCRGPQRRERRSSRHLCLRPSAHIMGRCLEGTSRLRLI